MADEDTVSPPTGSASPPTGSAHPRSATADPSDPPDPGEGGDGSAEGEDDIPPAPLWAMTNRMHSLRRNRAGGGGLHPAPDGRRR